MNRTRKPLSTHKQRSEKTEDGGFNRTNRPTNATSSGEGQRPRCCKADQRPPTPFEHRTQRRLPSPVAIPFLRSTRGRKRARGGRGPTPQDRPHATARGRPSAALARQGGDQVPHDAAAKRKESWLHPGPNDRPPRHPLQSGARGPRPPALRSPQPTRAKLGRRPEGAPTLEASPAALEARRTAWRSRPQAPPRQVLQRALRALAWSHHVAKLAQSQKTNEPGISKNPVMAPHAAERPLRSPPTRARMGRPSSEAMGATVNNVV